MTPVLQLQAFCERCSTPQHISIFHYFNLFVIIKFPVWPVIHKVCVSQGPGDFQQHMPGNFGLPQRPPHHMEPFRNQPPQGPQDREPLFMGGESCTQSS